MPSIPVERRKASSQVILSFVERLFVHWFKDDVVTFDLDRARGEKFLENNNISLTKLVEWTEKNKDKISEKVKQGNYNNPDILLLLYFHNKL